MKSENFTFPQHLSIIQNLQHRRLNKNEKKNYVQTIFEILLNIGVLFILGFLSWYIQAIGILYLIFTHAK